LKTRLILQPPSRSAGLGSLVQCLDIEQNTEEWFFIGPSAGGFTVEDDGHSITALNLHSPLGASLSSHVAGDKITLQNGRELEIIQVL